MTTEGVQRKMAAILCADVEGYTRLMQDDPEATLLTLKEYRAVFKHCSESLNGRIVDSPGDNILIEFPMTVDAVQCAVEIQRKLIEKNTELSENRRMQFRIGIDSGDLLEENGSLYGDGVNISARLQSLAESGGICISGRAHDQVVNRLPLKFEFLGKRSVKNITDPIRIYRVLIQPETAGAVVKEKKASKVVSRRLAMTTIIALIIIAAGSLIWNIYSHQPIKKEQASEPEQVPEVAEVKEAPVVPDVKEAPKTIAVLPFDNFSSDPEQEYFVDGLTEEIINSLTKIPDLLVTARTSSFTFKGSDKKVQEIANELGVAHILEGSVRKVGNSLRITTQLIRAADGFHLWSEIYDRELKDIFAIQEDIANNVADKLKLTIEALTRLGGTENIGAYELYLIGQGQFQIGVGYINTALESIDAAIALDPEFALAWAFKAILHYYLLVFGPLNQANANQDAGLSAALKAIELEPNLADGYNSLGFIQSSRGEFIEAESSYNKGVELANDTFKYSYYHYFAVGYFEKAHEILEEMIRKDPLNQELRGQYLSAIGFLGNMQRAEEEYAQGKALFGDYWIWGMVNINNLRLGTGDLIVLPNSDSEALNQSLESPEEGLAELHRRYDDIPFRKYFRGLSSKDYSNVWMYAAYFGDLEFSMDAMEKGLSTDSYGLQCVWYPVMKEVRKTPRFKKLIREIGLVDYWNEFGWPDICRQLENGDFVCD